MTGGYKLGKRAHYKKATAEKCEIGHLRYDTGGWRESILWIEENNRYRFPGAQKAAYLSSQVQLFLALLSLHPSLFSQRGFWTPPRWAQQRLPCVGNLRKAAFYVAGLMHRHLSSEGDKIQKDGWVVWSSFGSAVCPLRTYTLGELRCITFYQSFDDSPSINLQHTARREVTAFVFSDGFHSFLFHVSPLLVVNLSPFFVLVLFRASFVLLESPIYFTCVVKWAEIEDM